MQERYDAFNTTAQHTLTSTSSLSSTHMSIRKQWGNAQEATSILTALNYFASKDPNVTLQEVGMCGAGIRFDTTTHPSSNDLLVGASPDSLIHHGDGTLEVLEVKNHCPFFPRNWGGARRRRRPAREEGDVPAFLVMEQPLRASVPPAYVPQLMMEMMCLGDGCRSAVMLRQTATNGAVISRLRRDDEWIEEMLYWLNRFRSRYVQGGRKPKSNFFWEDDVDDDADDDDGVEEVGGLSGSARYRAFVDRTKEISESAELVDYVQPPNIQRVLDDEQINSGLFLD